MGNLLRLAVFILVLGALAAGTAAMLAQERNRERSIERALRPDLAASTTESASPPLQVLREHHTRAQQSLLLFGGLALVCAIALAVIPGRAAAHAADPSHSAARTEMRGLESLARATAAQRVELDQEREARHRSEQDRHLQQVLANHALQDKIRLGRDLHDGLVQSLYATGLMLETATRRLDTPDADPAEAARLLERAKSTLNAAIREARDTIGGLTPDALDTQSFPDAINALIDHLDGGRLQTRRVTLASDLPLFSEPARADLLQIIRESVSNALRHGKATCLEIDLAAGAADDTWRLVIRDDGHGFDLAAITRGHGLDNLAARARALGALLDIDAAPGRGTVLTLSLPAPAHA